MPLVMQPGQGVWCPVIICDHCGLPVTDARDGYYQWRGGRHDTDFGNRLYFTHNACWDPFRESRPEDDRFVWLAIPLVCLPIFLGNNLQLDWKEARRTANRLGSL